MFKIEPNPLYWWPVTFAVPDPDKPGVMREAGFEGQFRWLDDDAHAEWVKSSDDRKLAHRESARELLVSFRGVADAQGQPVESTPEAIDGLLKVHNVPEGVITAYFKSRIAVAEKN